MSDKDDKADVETANKAKPCETVERITNDEKVEVNETVNKKLTAMSKEAKSRKKKKLQKPPKDESTKIPSVSNNQIFLVLGIVGVIIAGVSLYYQRKTVMKMFKKDQKKVETPEVHVPHDERMNLSLKIII